MPQRLPIHDIWTDVVDTPGALEAIDGFVRDGKRSHTVFAVNPEKNLSAPADARLHAAFREADLLIPDGIGIVLAARLLHGRKLGRVTGADLMVDVCGLAAHRGYPVFILGSSEEVNREAVKILLGRFPQLKVAGRRNGYFTKEEQGQVAAQIAESGARILFAALGSPRQELWWLDNRDMLPDVRLFQGIGGTLDTLAGRVQRAPVLWQRAGLEWLYRLLDDPRRIRRAWLPLALFALRTLAAWPGARRRRMASSLAATTGMLTSGTDRSAK